MVRRSSNMGKAGLILGVVCVVGSLAPSASAAWVENFSTVSDGTLLQDVPGWAKTSGSDAIVTANSGLPGNGIALPSGGGGTNSYTRSLGPTEKATVADSGLSFSLTYKVDSTSYTNFSASFGESGTDNYYGISFGSGDLSVTAGTYTLLYGYLKSADYVSVGSYSANTWYRLDITGINLSSTDQGSNLPAASFSLYALDASGNVVSTAINGATVKAAGFDGAAFNAIDAVTLTGPWYTGGHTMSATDFALASVPEPTSIGFWFSVHWACCTVVARPREIGSPRSAGRKGGGTFVSCE